MIKAKANVNYYLEEDKSKLKDSTVVEACTGTVSTSYDKKGLAFATDGKNYNKLHYYKTTFNNLEVTVTVTVNSEKTENV